MSKQDGKNNLNENLKYQVDYKTFGCKVNTYDTGLIQKNLQSFANTNAAKNNPEEFGQDLVPTQVAQSLHSANLPKVHIVNTCAVTAEATQEAIRHIKSLKKKDPQSLIVVTGCAAQVDNEKMQIPQADLVVANSHKQSLADLIEKKLFHNMVEKNFHSNIFAKNDAEAGGGLEEAHSRAFLKVQDGCNSFCTYCVIPFARGKSRSISIPYLIDQVNELYDKGIREVVLTGVHIGDYAWFKDQNKAHGVASAHNRVNPDKYYFLEDLVESILKNTKMPRFRLASLEPVELSDRLIELYQDDKMCKQLHMSIQSANSKTLFAMKRKYDAWAVEKSLNDIHKKIPNAFVGMDVIVGFPGESEEDFTDTYTRLAELPWTRIHVFPYSDRPGTKASEFAEHILEPEIKARARRLRELSSERYFRMASEQIGSIKQSLLLTKNNQSFTAKDLSSDSIKKYSALSRDYWNIDILPSSFLEIEKHLNSPLANEEILLKIESVYKHPSRMDCILQASCYSKQ